MLEGVKSAVLSGKRASSAGVCKGEATQEQYRGWTDDERTVGLKALGRVYSGWGFSQPFYREKLFESVLGFKNIEDFMLNFWEAWALSKGSQVRSFGAILGTDVFRSRKHGGDAVHLASRRLFCSRAVQWRLRSRDEGNPS